MSFEKYLELVDSNVKRAVKIEWLNDDESVKFEFTNDIYDINVDLSVNYQNGSRRTCTIVLNNTNNKFPIAFDNIWIGQKFKLWMGIYLDEETPYYFPQGVFYISNPEDVYSPNTKTVRINGVDKWAFLDGTLHGYLSGTYQTNIGIDLSEATKELLRLPFRIKTCMLNDVEIINEYFDIKHSATVTNFNFIDRKFISKIEKTTGNRTVYLTLTPTEKNIKRLKFNYQLIGGSTTYFQILINGENFKKVYNEKGAVNISIKQGDVVRLEHCYKYYEDDSILKLYNISIDVADGVIDPTIPLISTFKDFKCPYTATVKVGSTYADILLEYATILCANIYYDVNGRLNIEPMINTSDDITDTNKEVLWEYSVDEKTFLGLTQTYNFDKVYNDIIVLGNVTNGKQFKARVQNLNIASDTCIQKIGIKTKQPIEDNQYYSDEQCEALAEYYAKVDTIIKKSGNIESVTLYHLDVNKIVTVSTPSNDMSKEMFLITGYSINSTGTMSINITSINVLKDFSVVKE